MKNEKDFPMVIYSPNCAEDIHDTAQPTVFPESHTTKTFFLQFLLALL